MFSTSMKIIQEPTTTEEMTTTTEEPTTTEEITTLPPITTSVDSILITTTTVFAVLDHTVSHLEEIKNAHSSRLLSQLQSCLQ